MSHHPRILLINPWIHDFAAYDVWAKPMGLLTLAAILREAQANVHYIDCLDRFHPLAPATSSSQRYGRGPYLKTRLQNPPGLEDIPRRFSRYGIKPEWFYDTLKQMPPPDMVLMTSQMTYWYTGVQETIQAVKAVYPEVPVVLGGIYASLCTAHARTKSGAVEVVPGAGEGRIIELVNRYTGAGLTTELDPGDLNTYPYPAFDLQNKINYVPVLTSRGCPFNCDYCASGYLEPNCKRRRPDQVMEEIAFWAKQYDVIDFVIYDDAFLVDAGSHALPLLEKIVNSGLKLRFHTPNALHIRNISKEVARLLFAAGFKTLRLGLERIPGGAFRSLDVKVTVDEYLRAANRLRGVGFKKSDVGAYLLVGLPDQTLEEIARSINFVKESGLTPIPAYYTPIPHTRLWPWAVASSRYHLADEPLFTNNAVLPCQKEAFSWQYITKIKNWVTA